MRLMRFSPGLRLKARNSASFAASGFVLIVYFYVDMNIRRQAEAQVKEWENSNFVRPSLFGFAADARSRYINISSLCILLQQRSSHLALCHAPPRLSRNVLIVPSHSFSPSTSLAWLSIAPTEIVTRTRAFWQVSCFARP